MVEYTVFIDDKEYWFTSLKYKRSYKLKPQPFTITVPLTYDITSSLLGKYAEIKRDNDTVFKGKIKSLEKGQGTVNLSGNDMWDQLSKLLVPYRRNSASAGTQVQEQIQNTDLTEGTIQSGDVIDMEYGSNEDSKFTRLRALREICFVTGYELYMSPTGTVDFKPSCGQALSEQIKFKAGELLKNWTEPFKIIDDRIKKVIVIGAGSKDNMCVGEAHVIGYLDGDPVKQINRKNLVTDETCTSAAQKLLDDLKNQIRYAKIDVIDTFKGRAYDIFDGIYVRDDYLGIAGLFRIFEIEKSFNLETGETTKIGICNLNHITSNAEYTIEKGEGAINDLLGRTEEWAKTHQIISDYPFLLTMKHHTTFESTDGYFILMNGNATYNIYHDYVEVKVLSGGSSGNGVISGFNTIKINKEVNPYFKAVVYTNRSTGESDETFHFNIGIGNKYSPSDNAWYYVDSIMIKFEKSNSNSKIYGKWRNEEAGYNGSIELQDWTGDKFYTVEAFIRNKNKLYFLIDGEVKAIATTNLPNMTDRVCDFFCDFGGSGNSTQDFIARIYNFTAGYDI